MNRPNGHSSTWMASTYWCGGTAMSEPEFVNHYACPTCKHKWTDVWSAQCDDDCPHCGAQHISPYKSDDVDPTQPLIKPTEDNPAGFFSVAVYRCDRAYGGPEEGGWWYDFGEPQLTEGFPIPILVATEEEIFDANQKLNAWIEA